jgi:hypothetical protein
LGPGLAAAVKNGTEQTIGAICERLVRATIAALDRVVLFPAPI